MLQFVQIIFLIESVFSFYNLKLSSSLSIKFIVRDKETAVAPDLSDT